MMAAKALITPPFILYSRPFICHSVVMLMYRSHSMKAVSLSLL